MVVYLITHEYERDGQDHSKIIGIYSTMETAEAAVQRARQRPGFRDYPDGFVIDRCTVDKDEWTEGFVTVATTNT